MCFTLFLIFYNHHGREDSWLAIWQYGSFQKPKVYERNRREMDGEGGEGGRGGGMEKKLDVRVMFEQCTDM